MVEPTVDVGSDHAPDERDTATPVIDPVCGMTVDPASAVSADRGGTTYHFCSAGCRDAFVADHDIGDPRDARGDSPPTRRERLDQLH